MTLFSWAHTTPPRTPLQSLPSGLREAHDGYDHLLVDASGVLLTGPGGAAPPLLLFSRRPHNASLIGNFWEFAVADHPGAAIIRPPEHALATRQGYETGQGPSVTSGFLGHGSNSRGRGYTSSSGPILLSISLWHTS